MSAARIAVTPEGRDGVWLADRSSLKEWIEAQGFDEIHNYVSSGPMLIGADHSVESVLADIDTAERIAILTGDSQRGNMGHALALIMPPEGALPERLYMYDIGKVTDADLESASAPSVPASDVARGSEPKDAAK